MHDNASVHTARLSRQWFENHPHITVLSWPAMSPDLNPMKHVWAIMAKEWEPMQVRTVQALEQHVREIWRTLERRHNIIRRIVLSMPQRLLAVMQAQGGYTKN